MSGPGLMPWQFMWDERGDAIGAEFGLRRSFLPGGLVRIKAHDYKVQFECHRRESDAGAEAVLAAVRAFRAAQARK